MNSKTHVAPYMPESYLGPMQHGLAIQKFDDAKLDCRWSIVRQHGCGDDHIAAIIESDRYRRLTWWIACAERVGATAALHPGDRDWPTSSQRRNLAADQIEVAHPIEVRVVGYTGRAIAGAKLRAEIDVTSVPQSAGLGMKARRGLVHGP